MDTDFRALLAMAQVYFDAAYDMDADQFTSIFHPSSSVTSLTGVGDGINVSVTPIGMWLATVRTMKAPRQLGFQRHDEILSIDVAGELAVLKVRLQIPPRYFTDVLSCARVAEVWKIVQKVTAVETRS
jgi:hypothetical protein